MVKLFGWYIAIYCNILQYIGYLGYIAISWIYCNILDMLQYIGYIEIYSEFKSSTPQSTHSQASSCKHTGNQLKLQWRPFSYFHCNALWSSTSVSEWQMYLYHQIVISCKWECDILISSLSELVYWIYWDILDIFLIKIIHIINISVRVVGVWDCNQLQVRVRHSYQLSVRVAQGIKASRHQGTKTSRPPSAWDCLMISQCCEDLNA